MTLLPKMSRIDTRWQQSAMIFDLQVRNIDFQLSSKSGATGISVLENMTFNGQMFDDSFRHFEL